LQEGAVAAGPGQDLMDALIAATPFEQPRLRMMGREVRTPRLVAWYGAEPYSYSGLTHPAVPLTPDLEELRQLASRLAGTAFNGVLLNLYRDGRDSMGWHSDDEPELGPDPVVASLSFGATRRFRLRHKRDPGRSVTIDLPHGSLLVMAGPTQHHWQHALPKTSRPVGPRLNLTFRRLRPGGASKAA
jgi:alkylated DNA repair dioxygenase AlkB